MPEYYSKYRILLSQLILGLYILGVFHAPVLELLHLISHSIVNHEHSGAHSFADHEISGTHTFLQVLNAEDDQDNETEHTWVTQLDKNEHISEIGFSFPVLGGHLSPHSDYKQNISSLIIDIPSPPPEDATRLQVA